MILFIKVRSWVVRLSYSRSCTYLEGHALHWSSSGVRRRSCFTRLCVVRVVWWSHPHSPQWNGILCSLVVPCCCLNYPTSIPLQESHSSELSQPLVTVLPYGWCPLRRAGCPTSRMIRWDRVRRWSAWWMCSMHSASLLSLLGDITLFWRFR